MKSLFPLVAVLSSLAAFNFSTSTLRAQGSLTPPGAPVASMKTLEQLEPRVPISTPGYTITNSGSYYVTTNLRSTGSTVILIQTNNVTLDLNGFTLDGNGGSSTIISSSANAVTNIWVRNGHLRNTTQSGVAFALGRSCRVSDLLVNNCTQDGIAAGSFGSVENCVVSGCNRGIFTSSYGVIKDCRVSGCVNYGVDTGVNADVKNCVVQGVAFYGFFCDAGTRVMNSLSVSNSTGFRVNTPPVQFVDCLAEGNSGQGFLLVGASQAVDCSALGNNTGFDLTHGATARDCTAAANSLAGFNVSTGGGRVLDCLALTNTTYGISTGAKGLVSGTTVENNGLVGIFVTTNHVTLKGNQVRYNGYAGGLGGIYFSAGTGCEIEGNTVDKNHGNGIFCNAIGTTNNLIIQNRAVGNTFGNYVFNTTNHFVNVSAGNLATNLNPYVNFSF